MKKKLISQTNKKADSKYVKMNEKSRIIIRKKGEKYKVAANIFPNIGLN